MKNMVDWARKECILAAKRENPKIDLDGDEFDYGVSCYRSALKAYVALYKAISSDEHSGASFEFTKEILIDLLNGQILTPITDADFFVDDPDTIYESEEYLKEKGLKSSIQCPRYSGLFRDEDLEGNVTYKDVNRVVCVNAEDPSDTYYSGFADRIVDEMFPVTLPYKPSNKKYKMYTVTFLSDKANGDFDTKGYLYLITPEGKRINIYRYFAEKENEFVEIPIEEYMERQKLRIDKIHHVAAQNILWTLIENSSDDEEIERRLKAFEELSLDEKVGIDEKLDQLCKIFEYEPFWKYNTFGYRQAICRYDIDKLKDQPQLMEIAEYCKEILEKLK